MLEFKHLQLLLSLQKHGSLALASEELHVTPSALSHQLKEIESYYGIPLVNRKTRPVKFTEAGKEVLKLADKVLPLVHNTKTNLKKLASGQLGSLRLASECHSCFDWLMPVLNQYRIQFPDVELDFTSGFEPEPHNMLVHEDIDVLITSSKLPNKELCYFEVFCYESKLTLAPSHLLAKQPYIYPKDIKEETLIAYPVEQNRLDIIAKFLQPVGITPKNIRTTDLTAMLIQLVASERGIAALPDWVVAEYEKKGWVVSKSMRFEDKDFHSLKQKQVIKNNNGVFCPLYACIRKQDENMPYMKAFIDLIKQVSLSDLF